MTQPLPGSMEEKENLENQRVADISGYLSHTQLSLPPSSSSCLDPYFAPVMSSLHKQGFRNQ